MFFQKYVSNHGTESDLEVDFDEVLEISVFVVDFVFSGISLIIFSLYLWQGEQNSSKNFFLNCFPNAA